MNDSTRERFKNQNQNREWVARTNAPGNRSWFVYNERTKSYHYSETGSLVRYSFEGAVRKADDLNGKHSSIHELGMSS